MEKINLIKLVFITMVLILFASTTILAANNWSSAELRLPSKWAENVNPENAYTEYPRPQMKREGWKNLNGLWDFALTSKLEPQWDFAVISKMDPPDIFDDQILVPFPVESELSGIKERVGAANRVWYKKEFTVNDVNKNGRVLLHFGASDWETDVYINRSHVGKHRGGYDPFTFDITEHIKSSGPQEIVVTVWDPTDTGSQPVGKQTHNPRNIWYTPVTGIWQTVWLEYVPETYIKDIKITPEVDNNRVKVEVCSKNATSSHVIKATVKDKGNQVNSVTGFHANRIYINIDNPKLWSPNSPFLYDLELELLDENGDKVDQVKSYFGMRKISINKAEDGYTRIFLNNEPLFQYGVLDQGFWPGGIYTAPSDEALKYDIQVMKDIGLNMLRKHVKVEPQRFYYWCDKIGILVWQDMPNSPTRPNPRHEDSKKQFIKEYKNLINSFYNHPSIVTWVPFNEGWGQFDTKKIVELTTKLDPSRLVDNASGWVDRKIGDLKDIHDYPGPGMPETEDNRAAVLGEFGGQALVVEDHLWLSDFSNAPDHYETSQSEEKLHSTYKNMLEKLMELKDKGLAAAIYTQLTDVETEVNGYMTYDRKVVKFDEKELREIHNKLINK